MKTRIRSAYVPKSGSTEREYEDAFFPRQLAVRGSRTIRLAVADGATESVFSKLWANKLVRAFGRSGFRRSQLCSELRALAQQWRAEVGSSSLPWYVEPKVDQGASAAFAGLEIMGSTGVWRAMGLGDSCLFQIRAGKVICTIPIASSTDFGNHPILIQSNTAVCEKVVANFWWRTGTWVAGDSFLLMTDAVACWFIGQIESGGDPWKTIRRVCGLVRSNPRVFRDWVASVRGEGLMRNDDVTVVWAQLGRD